MKSACPTAFRVCEPYRQCRRGPRESSRCSSLESPPQLRSQSSSQCRCAHHLFGFPRVASFKPGVARVPEVHASLSVGGGDGRRQLKDDHHWCRDGHELPGFSNPAYSVLVSLGLIHIGVEIAAMRHDCPASHRLTWPRVPPSRPLQRHASHRSQERSYDEAGECVDSRYATLDVASNAMGYANPPLWASSSLVA